MFKWKEFIKGPNLQDESISFSQNTVKPPQQGNLTGLKASESYEEIINLPSSSHKYTKKTNNRQQLESLKRKLKKERPKFVQLMRFCEENNIVELSKAFSSEDLISEEEQEELKELVNRRDDYGWTLLMIASCAGSLECVDFLLRAGSDYTVKDKKGLSAHSLALKKGRRPIIDALETWIVDYCVKKEPREEESSSSDQEEEQVITIPEVSYCEHCRVNFSNKINHNKSIAHLIATTDGVSLRQRIYYGIPESNKGYQLMLQSGWDKDTGLGSKGQGKKFPVKTVLKRDRKGLGSASTKSAKVTHFGPSDPAAVSSKDNKVIIERISTIRKKEENLRKIKEKRKEIRYRRELGGI